MYSRKVLDIFAAVQSSSAKYGVVPFENSSNGPVDMTLDCLIDRSANFSDLTIACETFVDVNHCLLGRKQGGQSVGTIKDFSTDLARMQDIYSHPQALGQCHEFLSKRLKSAREHETSSTSEAASKVAKIGASTAAAISSRLAAHMYGLDILASAIQDQKDNTTRFLVLQKDLPSEEDSRNEADTKWKALVQFTIDHESAGALADALHVFKDHTLNLTSINSRPSRARPWHYVFLAEVECFGTLTETSRLIKKALAHLGQVTEGHKYLGKWQG